METLYIMRRCTAAQSGLWAWQKEIYKMAEHYEHCLFTEKGIKELAAKMQKRADLLKGKDREIVFSRWTCDDDPYIRIGPGGHSVCVQFVKVLGSWAPMVEKVEATRGEIVSIEGHSFPDGYTDIKIRFYDGFPLPCLAGKDVLVTMEEV